MVRWVEARSRAEFWVERWVVVVAATDTDDFQILIFVKFFCFKNAPKHLKKRSKTPKNLTLNVKFRRELPKK